MVAALVEALTNAVHLDTAFRSEDNDLAVGEPMLTACLAKAGQSDEQLRKGQLLHPAAPYYPSPRGKFHTGGNTWSFTVGRHECCAPAGVAGSLCALRWWPVATLPHPSPPFPTLSYPSLPRTSPHVPTPTKAGQSDEQRGGGLLPHASPRFPTHPHAPPRFPSLPRTSPHVPTPTKRAARALGGSSGTNEPSLAAADQQLDGACCACCRHRAASANAGLGSELLQELSSADVKARLKANTEEAVANGAFGSPFLLVSGGKAPFEETFCVFGSDRFEQIAYVQCSAVQCSSSPPPCCLGVGPVQRGASHGAAAVVCAS